MEAEQPAERAKRETRFGRGWRLTRASWRVTRRSRTIILLAALASIFALAATGTLFYAAVGHALLLHRSSGGLAPLVLLLAYPLVFASVFFHVAIASAAGAHLEGGPVRVRDAVARTFWQGDHLALWSLLLVAAGLLFRSLGAVLSGPAVLMVLVLELVWILVTIFVVPLLALEDVGPVDALRRSRGLLRRAWGEGLTGLVGIGLWQVLLSIPALLLLVAGLATAVLTGGSGLVIFAVGGLGLLLVGALAGAVRQVFAVELYRYASSSAA